MTTRVNKLRVCKSGSEIEDVLSDGASFVISGLDGDLTPIRIFIYPDDTGIILTLTDDLGLAVPLTDVAFETPYDAAELLVN